MVVTGRWSDEARAAVDTANVDSLILNYALGFDEADLQFLAGLPLRKLVVLDRRLPTLEPIYELAPTLQSLELTTDPSLTIDLNRLSRLTELSADWSQVKATFSAGVRLQRLFLSRYLETDLVPLTPARSLIKLTLKDRPGIKSLNGLRRLPAIAELGVYLAKNLSDTTDLRSAAKLRELHLEACKRIETLADLSACTGLEFLDVSESGDFPDLEPLRPLSRLEVLHLYGSTRILNGDLAPIMQLPSLRELRMQNRRTYKPSVDEIQQRISGAPG